MVNNTFETIEEVLVENEQSENQDRWIDSVVDIATSKEVIFCCGISYLFPYCYICIMVSASSVFVCTNPKTTCPINWEALNLATRFINMEKMGETVGKSKRIDVRLTEEEYNIFKQKSVSYSSMSSLVIDAVMDFNTKKGKNTIDTMIEFSSCIRKYDAEIARVGNNLNQIAHQLNSRMVKGVEQPSLRNIQMAIDESRKLNFELFKEIRRLGRKK